MLISAAQLLDVTLLGPGRFLLACLPIYLNLTSKSGSGVKITDSDAFWFTINLPWNVNKI